MKIVVTTPTGHIGSAVARHLLDAGADVTVLVRNPARLDKTIADKATVKQGDLTDAAFVQSATQGADTLFWLVPPAFTTPDQKAYYGNLGQIGQNAVTTNGIGRVLFLSSIGADKPNMGPVTFLGRVENALNETDANILHLRPAFFFENFVQQIDPMAQTGAFYMPVRPNLRQPMIATEDIARVAAEQLLNGDFSGKQVLGLHGPADLSMAEAAAQISEGVRRTIRYVQIPPDALRTQLLQMGASEAVADGLLELYAAIDRAEPQTEARTPETTTATTLKDWASRVLKPALDAKTQAA